VSPPLERRIESDSSFERLYRQHRRDVYGAVLRDVRNPAEAEDVTQAAFLTAFRAMRKGERPEKPRAWLVTIARNVIRRRYREHMRKPQEVALDPDFAAALTEIEDPTAGEITAALRRLAPNQRRVIVLREIQGRSYAEIAQEMELSLSAVETLIFRARRSLREELEAADRAPVTRQRRRGFFLLPLPGFSKLSFGFSLGRAGAAALVGSVAIVTLPLEGGADPVARPAVQPGPFVSEVAVEPADPPARAAPATKDRPRSDKTRGDGDSQQAGGKETSDPVEDGGATSAIPDAGLPSVTDAESVLPTPLPVEPAPLPVDPDLGPLPEPVPLPEVQPLPEVDPLPLPLPEVQVPELPPPPPV
jgi:RNA polymerase sigma factor (sigma-70 family)